MKRNDSEAEIDRIRLELHEETKDLTIEEHTGRVNELAGELAAQYGFVVCQSASTNKTSKEKPSKAI